MTFSQEVKNELCLAHLVCKDCKRAILYGMLTCCRGVHEDAIILSIENKTIVDFLTECLVDIMGVIVTVESPNIRQYSTVQKKQGRPLYTIKIENKNDVDKIVHEFFVNIENRHNLNHKQLEKKCCLTAFLRGVFLICGSIINPQREYHFELSISSKRLATQIKELLFESGFDFKLSQRANSFVIYIKENNLLEDMLTFLGAVKSTFELINLIIEKEMRNNINRVTNCETANIGKTINASIKQIEQIKKIKESVGFDSLPTELQEVALLRLMNPEASLAELCVLSSNTISKSGLNHRLKKLLTIASELD